MFKKHVFIRQYLKELNLLERPKVLPKQLSSYVAQLACGGFDILTKV